jgi:hypothetical protein
MPADLPVTAQMPKITLGKEEVIQVERQAHETAACT